MARSIAFTARSMGCVGNSPGEAPARRRRSSTAKASRAQKKGGLNRSAGLRCRKKCASKARIIYGGRFHLESCRLIRKLTSDAAGQLASSKPRDKGRLGRPSDPTGRNVNEVRAGLERVDADADPPFSRGRPRGQGSNRRTHLSGLPGYWTQHVGMVMRVIEGDPSGSEVAASTPLRSGGSDGCRTGSYDRRSRVTLAEERTLTSGALSTLAKWG